MTGANPFPDDPLDEREALYAFEHTGPDTYRVAPVTSGLLRLYGGAILSQCFAAARLTVPDDKIAHSFHAYFCKPGQLGRPNDFAVSRETDGRSFANRLVRMTQDGVPLMNCMVSFKSPEPAPRHAMGMPDVPPPESLESLVDICAWEKPRIAERHLPFWTRRQQVDWRPVEPFEFGNRQSLSPLRHFWFRFNGPVGDGIDVHQRLLAYASDLHIFHTGVGPMGLDWADDRMQMSSLDHAVWFHGPEFRVDEWLLYVLDSPAGGNALALGRGNIFRRDGTLVASASQQGLARMLDEKREGKL